MSFFYCFLILKIFQDERSLQKKEIIVFPQYSLTQFMKLEPHIVKYILEENEMFLVDGKGRTIDTNVWIVACTLNYYLVRCGELYALYRRDGKLLAENIERFYIFPSKWLLLTFRKSRSLYRPDATLVVDGVENAIVLDDGGAYLTKEQDCNWKLFGVDGKLVAENIVDFDFYDGYFSSTFYVLQFADFGQ